MKRRKKTLALSVLAVAVLAAGIGIYTRYGIGLPYKGPSGSGEEDVGSVSGGGTGGPGEIRTEYTEEEKALLESQTGVTVDESGTMNVDVGAILAAEEEAAVSRAEAGELADAELGGDSEITDIRLQKQNEARYWIVRANKGGSVYQVWVEADTGDIFINQKE